MSTYTDSFAGVAHYLDARRAINESFTNDVSDIVFKYFHWFQMKYQEENHIIGLKWFYWHGLRELRRSHRVWKRFLKCEENLFSFNAKKKK